MFAHSHNVVVSGGSLNHAEGDIHTHTVNNFGDDVNSTNAMHARQILQAHIAAGAMHDSKERYDAPKCHEDTRIAVLKDISGWILDENKTSVILWLSAPAGSGKSAILQNIAEEFHGNGHLAGSFFFSRTAAKRNTETFLIATIAYQLATAIPATRPFIERAILGDPSIFERVLLTQMRHLIRDPLIRASLLPDVPNTSWPTLLVIDGLDECNGTRAQADILHVFREFLGLLTSSLPRFYLLIASRPEPAIRKVFENSLSSISYHIVLNDSYEPERDIALYLRSRFADIYRCRHQDFPTMMLLPQPWPSDDVINFLVTKSSGQFIFASTVLRFIDVDRKLPSAQLNIVLDICKSMNASHYATNPFALLDNLYAHVLRTSQDLAKVLSILGVIFFLKGDQAPTVGFLEALLQLNPEDITLLFWDLHSIVHIPANCSQSIHFYHASFRDFLVDNHRSQELFVDEFAAHSLLLESCLYSLCQTSSSQLLSMTQSPTIQYSRDWWSVHYVNGNRRTKGSLDAILGKYDPTKTLTTYYTALELDNALECLSPARASWHQRCSPKKCSPICSKYSSILDKKLFLDPKPSTIAMALLGLSLILFPSRGHPQYWMGNTYPGIKWFWDFIDREQRADLVGLAKGFFGDEARSGQHFIGSGISDPHFAYICAKNICQEISRKDNFERPNSHNMRIIACLHHLLSMLLNYNKYLCEIPVITNCTKAHMLELENFAKYTETTPGILFLSLEEQRKRWEYSRFQHQVQPQIAARAKTSFLVKSITMLQQCFS